MNFFINEILENDQIKEILKDYNRKDEAKEIAEKVMNGETVKVENGIFPICVLAYLAPYAIRKNEQRGIIKEVTVKSLKDINVWIDNYFIKNENAQWLCRKCGHVQISQCAPKICPVCKHTQNYFELFTS